MGTVRNTMIVVDADAATDVMAGAMAVAVALALWRARRIEAMPIST